MFPVYYTCNCIDLETEQGLTPRVVCKTHIKGDEENKKELQTVEKEISTLKKSLKPEITKDDREMYKEFQHWEIDNPEWKEVPEKWKETYDKHYLEKHGCGCNRRIIEFDHGYGDHTWEKIVCGTHTKLRELNEKLLTMKNNMKRLIATEKTVKEFRKRLKRYREE